MESFGEVTSLDETVVEFFPTREDAEAMIRRVAEDEPELAARLRVEPVEFETAPN